ncbi:acid-sensing ion channel 1 [Trichonephila inaurata madagascariensis]|uniref:Acid-sensing ion channel 1 n=1 Tax=Trichonephila inaurata madagascariensis TaxID=2747483 RepID=A0A8X6WN31_9ARAC|nr:acid-sensing ion channel 1 [Trichonephila inaurata madagascariensis]
MKLLDHLCKTNNIHTKTQVDDFNAIQRNVKNEKLVNSTLKSKFKNSSIFAVSQIDRSEKLYAKLLWMLTLSLTLVGCCYYIYRFMDLYFTYPIKVTLNIEVQSSVNFPSVTVCNMNRMKSKYEPCLASDADFRKCSTGREHQFGSGFTFKLPERRNFQSCYSQLNGKRQKDADNFTEFFEKYSELKQVKRRFYGHQLKDLIQSCSFRGKPYDKDQFSYFFNARYGNCFTFNSCDDDSYDPKEELAVTSTGRESGLELILNVEHEQYLPISHTIGGRIVIHNSLNPDPEGSGISIIPGYETDILLQQTSILRLPAPYKDECVFYNDDSSIKNQAACIESCLQDYNLVKCGCIEPEFQDLEYNDLKKCDMKSSTDMCCLDGVLNYLAIHGTNCSCPLPCVTEKFTEHTTMATWPSGAYFFRGGSNVTNKDWDSLKSYRASHAKINIFFTTLEKIVYEQKPCFHESELLSHLGGELGLWLGLSIVAVFELLEVLFCFANCVYVTASKTFFTNAHAKDRL